MVSDVALQKGYWLMKYGVAIQGLSPESLISVRVIHIGKESLLVHTITLAKSECQLTLGKANVSERGCEYL